MNSAVRSGRVFLVHKTHGQRTMYRSTWSICCSSPVPVLANKPTLPNGTYLALFRSRSERTYEPVFQELVRSGSIYVELYLTCSTGFEWHPGLVLPCTTNLLTCFKVPAVPANPILLCFAFSLTFSFYLNLQTATTAICIGSNKSFSLWYSLVDLVD